MSLHSTSRGTIDILSSISQGNLPGIPPFVHSSLVLLSCHSVGIVLLLFSLAAAAAGPAAPAAPAVGLYVEVNEKGEEDESVRKGDDALGDGEAARVAGGQQPGRTVSHHQ